MGQAIVFRKSVLVRLALTIFGCLWLTGCAGVQLVSRYDEQIDTTLTSLYATTTTFVDQMIAKAKTPEGEYEANRDFYATQGGVIESLIARAESIKVLGNCPSVELVTKAVEAARPDVSIRPLLDTIPQDDCQVTLFRILKSSYQKLEDFHRAQGRLGIPASARGPLLDGGVGAVIRAGITVEAAKKAGEAGGGG